MYPNIRNKVNPFTLTIGHLTLNACAGFEDCRRETFSAEEPTVPVDERRAGARLEPQPFVCPLRELQVYLRARPEARVRSRSAARPSLSASSSSPAAAGCAVSRLRLRDTESSS